MAQSLRTSDGASAEVSSVSWRWTRLRGGLAHNTRLGRRPLAITKQPDESANHRNEGDCEKHIGPKHIGIRGGLRSAKNRLLG